MKLFARLRKILINSPRDLLRRIMTILVILLLMNVFVWLYAFYSSFTNSILLGLVALAYGLGLRHAVDVDHIAAIDGVTRKLMQDGKRPAAVGFFFSLGHATVVIILSLMVAFSASFVKDNLPAFKQAGSLIGAGVSSFFLLFIGIINLIVLFGIYKIWRKVKNGEKLNDLSLHDHLESRGLLARILKPLLKTVKNSWGMYFIGFLFGLGFDTASEIGLLSISAVTGISGMSIINIILLPAAFTAGMCLIDTLDGILMLGAYGWAFVEPTRKLYYNMSITLISVLIALVIGGMEALQITGILIQK